MRPTAMETFGAIVTLETEIERLRAINAELNEEINVTVADKLVLRDELAGCRASNAELVGALQETRDACAECFRVIASAGQDRIDELQHHLANGGIKDGFGKRADAAIAKATGETP